MARTCPYAWSAPRSEARAKETKVRQKCSLSIGHEGPHRSLTNVTSTGFLLQPQPECKHTPCPAGYIEFAVWAEKMRQTHRQERCPICGLWAIWTPKPLTEYEARVLAALVADAGWEQMGDGPRERAWVAPRTSAEASAMGRLARRGLVERRPGYGKMPTLYRHVSPLAPDSD